MSSVLKILVVTYRLTPGCHGGSPFALLRYVFTIIYIYIYIYLQFKQPLIQWVPGTVSSQIKRLACEVDHLLSPNVEVKNVRS
jgi:hypothetical protein